ncbi:uncharacterized protein TNCV_3310881 [Trichonephila clavipes]|nr:uncharacterized protein TNCV_3310881 [Trichonephila clavipes]
MYIYTLEESLFICYKQSNENPLLVAFSQRTHSLNWIEDEAFKDNETINNLIDYEDGQEEADSFRVDKIYAGIQLFNKLEKYFLKIDSHSERSMRFQEEFQPFISDCRDIYKQVTILLSSQKLHYGAKK